MQQRAGIARALAVQPDILLMDQPRGALDLQTRDLLQDEMPRIWQTDRNTLLFVRAPHEALKTSPALPEIRREIWGLLKQEATIL
jgi:ABC-type nitrate/sulfonate/bicarbonate transport system ATPase subunit